MTQIAEKIFSEALTLDEKERAELAARLMESLDPSSETDDAHYTAAWDKEIEERLRRLDSGEEQAIPWPEARRMIVEGGKIDEAG